MQDQGTEVEQKQTKYIQDLNGKSIAEAQKLIKEYDYYHDGQLIKQLKQGEHLIMDQDGNLSVNVNRFGSIYPIY